MEKIILIETSSSLCSVALSCDGQIISYKESSGVKAHASLTVPFIKEMLYETGTTINECNAVCVSMGPGSYTGLRVGVSTAKGICFGAGIPLLAVGTLDTLVAQAQLQEQLQSQFQSQEVESYRYIIPMIDARRMEVYTAVFTPDGTQTSQTEPKIIDCTSFASQLEEGPVLFIGDAAEKCASVITHPNAHFVQCCPKASSMAIPAHKEYKEKRFKDVAYFEPFYLKEFVATVSKKKLF